MGRRRGLVAGGCILLLTGCVFTAPEREYVSNRPVLDEIPEASRYEVDPDLYALTGADVREDSITYHFQGVKSVADHGWVVRFSQKSTEQNPESLMNVAALLPLIAAGKRGMSIIEEDERAVGDLQVRYIRYRFDSPVRDAEGKPFPAHGIIAAVRKETSGGTVVYHIKLDNHGDRDEVTLQDLEPFLAPIAR